MPQPPLRVFTSAIDLGGNLSQLAGVTGPEAGDVLCQRIAEAESLSGTWVSYLTTDGGSGAARFTANGPWNLVGGGVVFSSRSAVGTSQPMTVLGYDERGDSTGPRAVWTGRVTNSSGQFLSCGSWSTRSSRIFGGSGNAGTKQTWDSNLLESCAELNGLVCFEQARTLPDGGTSAAPPKVASKRVFCSARAVSGDLPKAANLAGTGLAAGDALCTGFATDAGLGGRWRAYLSTFDTVASDRFSFRGPWTLVGTDGGVAVDSVEQLELGRLRSRIALDERGQPVTTNGVWTGTRPGHEQADERCSDWVSASSLNNGGSGTTSRDDGFWQAAASTPCNTSLSLYCFEM